MKASDRGRNVKSKELFGCFDEFFISMLWTCLVFFVDAMIPEIELMENEHKSHNT